MPASYTWFVSGDGSGASIGSGAAYGTGADGRTPYACSRQMNPQTGDVIFDQSRSSWALGAPIAERVLRTLRTQKGSARRDPSYGVDWSQVDNARANVASIATQAIRNALAEYVTRGELSDLDVQTETQDRNGGGVLMALQVSFRDARGAQVQLTGRRS
jgi:phage baseplate assembly protein W